MSAPRMVAGLDLAATIGRYARRFHGPLGDGHHVASPLGAWLLLALCASAGGEDTVVRELEAALGVEAGAAAEAARVLLADPHPLVAAAAAVWNQEVIETEAWARWRDGLPRDVERGHVPGQADLDAWARDNTLGLIDRFPLSVEPDTLAVLATALATKVSWCTPFELAPADALGTTSPWAGRLTRVLRAPADMFSQAHIQFVASSRLGDVIVHAARAAGGLTVVSVGAQPGVPAAEVLALAHELAAGLSTPGRLPTRSLFDLPLGEGPLWTLREEPTMTIRASGREERCSAVLPAWKAASDHKLEDPALGITAAARLLTALVGPSPVPFEAVQSVVARYTRVGFEAAAVTAMSLAGGLPPEPKPGVARVAELRFGHPYAVVAVAERGVLRWDEPERGKAWAGVPVFSAWVVEPTDATG